MSGTLACCCNRVHCARSSLGSLVLSLQSARSIINILGTIAEQCGVGPYGVGEGTGEADRNRLGS